MNINNKYNKLTILYTFKKKNNRGHSEERCHCRCDCGNEKDFGLSKVIYGHVKSCGRCHEREHIGETFGFLTILSTFYKNDGTQNNLWCHCKCNNCGSEHDTLYYNVVNGHAKSCGCSRKDSKFKHQDKNTYIIWRNMLGRCCNKTDSHYKYYGGRGITVCDRWKDSFDDFYEDMGKRPSKEYSIDRIDVNGNYEPDNCKWSTRIEQANNTTRNVYYDYQGEKLTLAQICRKLDLPYKTIWKRIHSGGVSLEDTLVTPVRKLAKRLDS